MIDTYLELALIEELWDAPHCESRHRSPKNQKCSHVPVVTFSRSCDMFSARVCELNRKHNLYCMTNNVLCAVCYRPASECWSVTPLPAS